MTNESDALSEREEIEALLPWYATGKLDASSRARVEAYLADNPTLHSQLVLIDEDRDAAWRANSEIAPPRTLSADRLLERARGPKPLAVSKPMWSAAMDMVRDFFGAPTASGVRWATAAAVAIMLAQAAVIGGFMRERPHTGFETASGGAAQSADGRRVLVRFQADARLEAIASALAGLDMRIVDGPKPGGLFVVRIAGASDDVTSAQIAKLRNLPALVAVVLPMGP